jgi:hypothetical protein
MCVVLKRCNGHTDNSIVLDLFGYPPPKNTKQTRWVYFWRYLGFIWIPTKCNLQCCTWYKVYVISWICISWVVFEYHNQLIIVSRWVTESCCVQVTLSSTITAVSMRMAVFWKYDRGSYGYNLQYWHEDFTYILYIRCVCICYAHPRGMEGRAEKKTGVCIVSIHCIDSVFIFHNSF